MRALNVDHLFEAHRANLAIRKSRCLRKVEFDVMRLLTPTLDRRPVEQALAASRA
ncbi:MAG: hypothetical protein HY322_09195 [Betaproteobacteria bacterium]|nr:hypothetical protein [Betaproteobacteria bacterium]